MLREEIQPVPHEHVVVGLVAGGSPEPLDAGSLGDGDPDLGNEHTLDVECHDHLVWIFGRTHRAIVAAGGCRCENVSR